VSSSAQAHEGRPDQRLAASPPAKDQRRLENAQGLGSLPFRHQRERRRQEQAGQRSDCPHRTMVAERCARNPCERPSSRSSCGQAGNHWPHVLAAVAPWGHLETERIDASYEHFQWRPAGRSGGGPAGSGRPRVGLPDPHATAVYRAGAEFIVVLAARFLRASGHRPVGRGPVLIVLVQLVPGAAVDRVLKQLLCGYVLLFGRAELVGRGPAELAVLGRLRQRRGPAVRIRRARPPVGRLTASRSCHRG
jgi:hypothetical protein